MFHKLGFRSQLREVLILLLANLTNDRLFMDSIFIKIEILCLFRIPQLICARPPTRYPNFIIDFRIFSH